MDKNEMDEKLKPDLKLAIKIDVDTLKGYLEGLPRMLDILAKRNIKASVFFSMGPDNSGKALRRVFRRGFLSKMLRTKAPATYGLKTLFYGTLLKAPMIVESDPDILRRAIKEGHDCGIHCWDHVQWQDCLSRMTREEIRGELMKAVELFSKISGVLPKSSAAPGWQVSVDSLTVQDEFGFEYSSDTRGKCPFMPRMGGISFRTLQIPSTLPTLDELWGTDGLDAKNVNDRYRTLLTPGLNVHTVHTEMEGGNMSGVFESFLDECLAQGASFTTLRSVASLASHKTARDDIRMAPIPGRAGNIAAQVSADPNA